DEMVQSKYPGENMSWPPLQKKLFLSDHGGEIFYETLDDLLRKPDTLPFIWEVFYLCLCYGFMGRDGDNIGKINQYKAKLEPRSRRRPRRRARRRRARCWRRSSCTCARSCPRGRARSRRSSRGRRGSSSAAFPGRACPRRTSSRRCGRSSDLYSTPSKTCSTR